MDERQYRIAKVIIMVAAILVMAVYVWSTRFYVVTNNGLYVLDKWNKGLYVITEDDVVNKPQPECQDNSTQ